MPKFREFMEKLASSPDISSAIVRHFKDMPEGFAEFLGFRHYFEILIKCQRLGSEKDYKKELTDFALNGMRKNIKENLIDGYTWLVSMLKSGRIDMADFQIMQDYLGKLMDEVEQTEDKYRK